MIINELLNRLDQQTHEVEQSYQLQAGGAAVCQLHKDGRISGGIKYDEGRLVALAAIQRMLKLKSSPQDILHTLQTELKTWQQGLDVHQGKEKPSMQWIAYLQGGVDILQQYAQELENLVDVE